MIKIAVVASNIDETFDWLRHTKDTDIIIKTERKAVSTTNQIEYIIITRVEHAYGYMFDDMTIAPNYFDVLPTVVRGRLKINA